MILARHEIEKALELNKFVLAIFIDLSVAFDSIDVQEILPRKLEHLGADKKASGFFKSFFNNRKHYVEWNSKKSKINDLYNISVCQGSCLGPVCYNTYTHDYKDVIGGCDDSNCKDTNGEFCKGDKSVHCDGIFFADDTLMKLSSKDIDKMMDRGNEELEKTRLYMNANKLIINEKKTQFLMIKPKRKKKVTTEKELKIKDKEIEQVSSAKYLGIIFNDQMNFKEQFTKLKTKLQEAVRALICTRYTLNFRAKMMLYNSAFESHITYATLTYFDKLSKKQINELYILQKQAVRLIFNSRKNTHSEKFFKMAGILPITRLFESEAIKLMFKNMREPHSKSQPKSLKELLIPEQKETEIESQRIYQNQNRIKIPNSYKKDDILYKIINCWNNAGSNVRNAGNQWSLKKALKEEFISSLPECNGRNCNICLLDANKDYHQYMSS